MGVNVLENIDIIMPVYNCEDYIKEAINSIKEQTIDNWKIIIIEDCSEDRSLIKIEEIIEDIKQKVILIKNKEHIGVANSRNAGIEKSKSKYIAFLDGDDIWDKEKLEKQIRFMKNSNYGFTYTKFSYLKGKRKNAVKIFPKKLDYKQALKNTFILTSTVMINTDKIRKENIYMPNIESEDTATWWNILKSGNIAYGLKDNLTIYRVHKNGISFNKLKNVKKTWRLYRKKEKLSIIKSSYYFINYVVRAILKRI